MAHWSDYTLRGWLSFLAFVHFGLLARSILDPAFIQDKIFTTSSSNQTAASDPLTLRVFGAFSLCQGFMLTHAAIHLYVLPVQYIAMFILSVNIYFVISESFYYKTMDFYGHVLLPSSMSIVSLLWLAVFHFVWKPWIAESIDEEHSLKSMYVEGKKKAKSKAAAAAASSPSSSSSSSSASSSTFHVEPRFFLFSRNRVSTSKLPSDSTDPQIRQRRRNVNITPAMPSPGLSDNLAHRSMPN